VIGTALRMVASGNRYAPLPPSWETDFNFTNAPRSLKEPVRCNVSSLRKCSTPVASDSGP
jgi:hypothetical protein